MEATVTRIERKIWSPHRGSFIATGETMDVDINTLVPDAKIPSGRFLKGPIPWSWIAAAAALPSRALLVGLCLWRLVGAMKTETVFFGNSDLRQLGIDRATKSRACRERRATKLAMTVEKTCELSYETTTLSKASAALHPS
jgi:hypothetical protein